MIMQFLDVFQTFSCIFLLPANYACL